MQTHGCLLKMSMSAFRLLRFRKSMMIRRWYSDAYYNPRDRIKRMLSPEEANTMRDGFQKDEISKIKPPGRHGDFHTPHPGLYPPNEVLEEDLEGPEGLEFRYNIPNYETEQFSFDPETGILQELQDEKDFYDQVVVPQTEKMTFKSFAVQMDPEVRGVPRDFRTSSDPLEWSYVDRLLPKATIPHEFEPGKVYPSGFTAPNRNEAREKGEYFVGRTRNHLMPVHVIWKRQFELVQTKLSHCEGNLFKLREDLDQFLMDRYQQKFISQVIEVYGKIIYHGDFEVDFKEFLLDKGF